MDSGADSEVWGKDGDEIRGINLLTSHEAWHSRLNGDRNFIEFHALDLVARA